MKSKGITAKQLTNDLEISNSTITDWKKGKAKPSTDAIIKLATYFNVSTDYILLGKVSSSSNSNIDTYNELIDLFKQLPLEKQIEFKGELKGYIRHMKESK